MIRFVLVLSFALCVLPSGDALSQSSSKSPPIATSDILCGDAFVKAQRVRTKPISFAVSRMKCRSLRDGPRGYQLQCFGEPVVIDTANVIEESWTRCLRDAGFTHRPQGSNGDIRVTHLRHRADRIVCQLINATTGASGEQWRVKMKCFGPR